MRVQVLSNDESLRDALARLSSRYQRLEAAVAWCGSPSQGVPYDQLEPIARGAEMLVGTDFDHTHPDGLAKLRDLGMAVRVVDMQDGIFHPKVYLFSRPARAALLIGSPNLTASAFLTSYEAAVLLEGTSAEMGSLVSQVRSAMGDWRRHSAKLKDDWLDDYRKRYRESRGYFKGKRAVLSPAAQDEESITPLTFIRKASWSEYYRKVSRCLLDKDPDGSHWSWVLSEARRLIPGDLSVRMLERQEVRSLLIGRGPDYCYASFGYVGAKGSGLPALLAHGTLRQKSFVVDAYNAVRRMGRGVDYADLLRISRRLCTLGSTMKVWGRIMLLARPALYLSVSNNGLRRHLSEQLGIAQYKLGEPEGYVKALRLLHSTPWFRSPRPSGPKVELRVWDSRVAYIDVLYYEV